jgi:hypothetical protein
MYPHFIEIHAREDGAELMINIDNIIGLGGGTHDRIAIRMIDNSRWIPRETYDEVKKLIKDAGCSINKGDPRIDTKHRLTMDQIRKMLGEPVWNSNLGSWALVHYYDPDRDQIQLLNSAGKIYVMDEEELIRYPLYRMIGGER